MKERILVLQSVNDQITRFREIRIKQSPFLQNYEFKYVYIIKLTSNDKRNKQTIEKAIERALNTSLDEKELTRRLKLEILKFNPNYFNCTCWNGISSVHWSDIKLVNGYQSRSPKSYYRTRKAQMA